MKRIATVLLLAAVVLVPLACRQSEHPAHEGHAGATAARPTATTLAAPLRGQLRTALDAHEIVRAALAADRLDSLANDAGRLAQALREARAHAGDDGVVALLEQAAAAAESLATAADLDSARRLFADVSRTTMALTALDPSLVEGWHVFSCPMVEGFAEWMQPAEVPDNPFMGSSMPRCAVPGRWEAARAAVLTADDGEIAYYTCAMHPSVRAPEAGKCPICSMDLTPVTHHELRTGVILVDAARRQAIGVRTATVERRTVDVTIRAVGNVIYDERRLVDVSVKYAAWIGTLAANQSGQRVEKGQTLFTVYSPELYAAQDEFLAGLASQRSARTTSVPRRADYLVDAARKRLQLWDIPDWQIERIADSGEAVRYLAIVSPVTGYVVEKNVVEGAAVEPGARLLRIANLDRVWVEAEVYEADLSLIEVGQAARVDLPYLPGRAFEGRVAFVYPYLRDSSRTGRVRIELDNAGHALKPDMYANVELAVERGERIVVPVEAVIYAGPRRVVFVDLGDGRLKPREVEVGIRSGDEYEVLAGLAAGEVVVTSGNFLIAAESRLKSATGSW